MGWLEDVRSAIQYMEEHLTEELSPEDVAASVHLSPFYFQKGFSVLCGVSVSEYLRNRRLTLAGRDLRLHGERVLDVALKYGYDSPDSFARAFTRFHGITPSQAKSGEGELRQYLPLKISISLKGGFEMENKIVKKPAFTVIGSTRVIKNEEGYAECPRFWTEHCESGDGEYISGMYGICMDGGEKGTFRYMIADDYVPSRELPDRFETVTIPESVWAVFPCRGPMPDALQSVNTRIYSEWLPGNTDYDLNGMFSLEWYSDTSAYPKGNEDENYYSEIWLPVKARQK